MKIEAVLAMHDRPIGPRVEWDGTSQITLPVGVEECDRVLLLADGVPFSWVGVEWSAGMTNALLSVSLAPKDIFANRDAAEQRPIRPHATLSADGKVSLSHVPPANSAIDAVIEEHRRLDEDGIARSLAAGTIVEKDVEKIRALSAKGREATRRYLESWWRRHRLYQLDAAESAWFERHLAAETGRIAKEALETPIDELVRHGQDVYRARELEKMTTIFPQAFKKLEPHPISPEDAARASEFFRANQIGPTAKNVQADFPGSAGVVAAAAAGYDGWQSSRFVRSAFAPGKQVGTGDAGEMQFWVDPDGLVVCKCCGAALGLDVYRGMGFCGDCHEACSRCTWQAKGPRPALEGAAIVGTEQPVRFVPVHARESSVRITLGDQEITGFASHGHVEIRRRGAVAYSDGSGCSSESPESPFLTHVAYAGCDWFEKEMDFALALQPKLDHSSPLYSVTCSCGAIFGGISETEVKKARSISEKTVAERNAREGLAEFFVHGAGNEPTSCPTCGETGHRPHCPEAK